MGEKIILLRTARERCGFKSATLIKQDLKGFGPRLTSCDPEWGALDAMAIRTEACVGRDPAGEQSTQVGGVAQAFKIEDGKARSGWHGQIISGSAVLSHASKAVRESSARGGAIQEFKNRALGGGPHERLQGTKRGVMVNRQG